MSEYIIEWFGIGEQLTRLREGNVPLVLWPKRIREERLHERIVRCRDCKHYKPYRTHRHGTMNRCYDENGNTHRRDERDFCSRGERREP